MEFLREPLGDELYAQVTEKLKGNEKIQLANIAEGKYIEKSIFDTEVVKIKGLETQITTTEALLNDFFKGAKGDNLEAKIADFQTSLKDEKVKQDQAFKDLQLQTAIRLSLVGNVKDEDIVLSLLNKNEIVLDDKGKIKSGLKEQLEDLQKSKSFLFVEESKNSLSGVAPAEGSSDNKDEGNKKTDPSVDFAKKLAGMVSTETTTENPYFK